MTNLFWSVITYRLICLVIIVMEGKLKTRSSAHGVSNNVNTVFSGKIVSFLAFQIPLAYTAVHNHCFHTPTLIWRTPSLQFHAGSCINVLEAHTELYPEEAVLTMTSYGLRRSQWPRGSATAWLLWLNPTCTWMIVSFQCWVLSGSFLCNAPISRPEESYRVLYLRVIVNPR